MATAPFKKARLSFIVDLPRIAQGICVEARPDRYADFGVCTINQIDDRRS
jgi:hypothetical protein